MTTFCNNSQRAARVAASLSALACALGCGARSSLVDDGQASAGGASSTAASSTAASSSSSSSSSAVATATVGSGGAGGSAPCLEGSACDTGLLGVCAAGTISCASGAPACVATTGPTTELCDGLDDDCDGTVDNDVDCTKRVFATSVAYTGDLGGLDGADAKCQGLADAAGLGGTYKAWLSDVTASAAERLTHVGAPYVLADGVTVVATDWNSLVAVSATQFLLHPIDLTETLGSPPVNTWPFDPAIPLAWTNTEPDGSTNPMCDETVCYSCGSWSTTALESHVGNLTAVDVGWTYSFDAGPSGFVPCDKLFSLVCFEQ
jgi:hypothetical protein